MSCGYIVFAANWLSDKRGSVASRESTPPRQTHVPVRLKPLPSNRCGRMLGHTAWPAWRALRDVVDHPIWAAVAVNRAPYGVSTAARSRPAWMPSRSAASHPVGNSGVAQSATMTAALSAMVPAPIGTGMYRPVITRNGLDTMYCRPRSCPSVERCCRDGRRPRIHRS